MENIALKTNENTGTLPAITKLGGASFSISFADLLNTTRIEDAGGLFAGRTDFASSKAEAPDPAQDRPRDDGGERNEANSENTDRPDAPPAPRQDNRDDGPAPVREGQGDEPRDDGAPPEKDQAHGVEADDDGSKQDETPKQAADAPDENKPANDTSSNDGGRTIAADAHVITPGQENATENAQQVLAGLITGAEDGTKQNHVAAQANERATNAPQRVNALDGLTRAADAIGKQSPTGGGTAGQTGANTHGSQAKGNVQQAQAPVNAKGAEETASKATADPVQQAFAKKIGDGARVQVNVVKEAAVLSSRPSATLARTSTQAADNGPKSQAGQGATHGNAPSAANSQAGQAGQQALGNVAGQQAVQQAQAALQGGAGGKGAAPGTLHVNAGQASEDPLGHRPRSPRPSCAPWMSEAGRTGAPMQAAFRRPAGLQDMVGFDVGNSRRPNCRAGRPAGPGRSPGGAGGKVGRPQARSMAERPRHPKSDAGQASEGGTLSATVPGAEARQAQQAVQAKQAANTSASSQPRQAVADQVTVQITKALQSGVDNISIQLKPASMGRIDVQMEVAKDGVTSLVITADNRETLDQLQRDARYLEQALKDAGLQADAGNMDFNMREGQESDGKDGESGSSGTATADADAGDEQDHPVLDGYIVGPDGRVDIRA